MLAPPMLACLLPQTARPPEVPVGVNPPWNQPQLTPLELSRSPTFLPVATASGKDVAVRALPSEQSSKAGSGSPYTVPKPALFRSLTPPGSGTLAPVTGLIA